MGAIVVLVLCSVAAAIAVARVSTHARWAREKPADEAWIEQLKGFNNIQTVVAARQHQRRRTITRR